MGNLKGAYDITLKDCKDRANSLATDNSHSATLLDNKDARRVIFLINKLNEREHIHQISLECSRKCRLSTNSSPKKVYIEDIKDFMRESQLYRDILKHRNNCSKWGKGFCLNCFGGGLTLFSKEIIREYQKETKGATITHPRRILFADGFEDSNGIIHITSIKKNKEGIKDE